MSQSVSSLLLIDTLNIHSGSLAEATQIRERNEFMSLKSVTLNEPLRHRKLAGIRHAYKTLNSNAPLQNGIEVNRCLFNNIGVIIFQTGYVLGFVFLITHQNPTWINHATASWNQNTDEPKTKRVANYNSCFVGTAVNWNDLLYSVHLSSMAGRDHFMEVRVCL